ncbi:hypothetical protein GGI12_005970 [Dipsacomyces acuminosporus]|nr:hypothetical protein GGI12_005970 [Dipsacomyces acuminosporus]
MDVAAAVKQLTNGERVVAQEWQYAITETRHIKLRKGIDGFGEKYRRTSKLLCSLTHGKIKVPKVLETGKLDIYEYVVTERIIATRETTNQDIEAVLEILEDVELPELLGHGYEMEKPAFLFENNRSKAEVSEKLDLISFKEKETIMNLFPDDEDSQDDTRYSLQHGDIRHRNIIIKDGQIYLVDLDTVGVYPYHFERFYITSYLGIPVSVRSIPDRLLKRECVIALCNTINDRTLPMQDIIETVKYRLKLVIDGQTSGINNVIQGLGIGKRFR